MFSIFTRKNADALVAYHQDDLAGDDVVSDDTETATWTGRASERLGLAGVVQRNAFRRLCQNQHPKTGAKFTARNSRKRRVAYDCVFSAPKSVSIMALVMDDNRAAEAHMEAATETTPSRRSPPCT